MNEDREEWLRVIRRETEQMTRAFDKYFLRACGVAWEDDLCRICSAIKQGKEPERLSADENGCGKK
jgi:hypothetical protein